MSMVQGPDLGACDSKIVEPLRRQGAYYFHAKPLNYSHMTNKAK